MPEQPSGAVAQLRLAAEMVAADKKPATVRQYRRFWRDFEGVAQDYESLKDIQPRQVAAWLFDPRWGWQTQAQALASLRYLSRRLELDWPALDKLHVRGLGKARQQGYYLDRHQLARLLELPLEAYSATSTLLALRNRAIIGCTIEAMLQVPEVLALNVEDWAGGCLTIALRPMPGNVVRLSEKCGSFLAKYLDVRDEEMAFNGRSPLFASASPTNRGGRMTQAGLHRAIAPVLASVIPEREYARSGFSITMLRESAERAQDHAA